MAVGMLQTVLLIVSGQLLFQTDYGANLGPILLTLLAFNLAVTGLGVLIASVAKNQAQIGVLSNLAAIIGAMLGGAWWPYELMSPVMRTLGLFTPAGWAIQAVSRLLNGGSLAGTVPSILVLVLMGGLFLCAGALGFRPERVARG
jgi:ABC-2 type transport system permease protein